MSDFWVIVIMMCYVGVTAIIGGIVYAIIDDETTASLTTLFWPLLLVATPFIFIGRFVYRLVKSIKEK